MTLIEVLAATVLLSILAATSARMLRDVRADSEGAPSTSLFELTSLADSFMTEPARFGVKTPLEKVGTEEFAIAWPGLPDRGLVAITRVDPQTPMKDHAWLVFRHGSLAVSRYVPLSVKDPKPK